MDENRFTFDGELNIKNKENEFIQAFFDITGIHGLLYRLERKTPESFDYHERAYA
jgi:hypothetical protein